MTDAHPLETWGQPTGEDRVHRALPDSGYLDASPRALERQAADLAYIRSLPPVLHQVDLDRQRREREEQAEVERLREPLARTRQLVDDIEQRQHQLAAAVAAGDRAAADALISGTEAPPAVSVTAPETLDAELRAARLAVEQLENEMVKAADLLERRQHGVSRCALAVMVADAADLGDEIIAADMAIAGRRADLDALSRLITTEGRRLNRTPPSLPGQVSRALTPGDPILTGIHTVAPTDWSAVYRELCEAPTGSVSDTDEADAQQPSP